MERPLAGKVALVTGGARGIGLATSRLFAAAGARLLIGARDGAQADAAANRLREIGYEADGLKLDVTNEDDRNAARVFVERTFGVLDILINNAAIWLESENAATPPSRLASELQPDVLRRTFETNFFGPIFLTQQLLPLLRLAEAARIVNVSSIRGSLTHQSDPDSPFHSFKALAYDTSKVALNAFTVQLADELRRTPIKVNAVHPGWVRTDMGSSLAHLDVEEGARTTLMYASLADDGPTGGFFYLGERLPW